MSTVTEDVVVSCCPHARPAPLEVVLLTGGFDRPYAYGLAMALIAKGFCLDVIGSEYVDSQEMHTTPGLQFFNLWPSQPAKQTILRKLWRVFRYYSRLIRYAAVAKPKVFHILWNSKVEFFDRTLLMLYYKTLRKKVALTAHNVNECKRDGNDSFLNRLTLRIQYSLTDHIFVHTQKMKDELIRDFGVRARVITVIRYPIDVAFPDTTLTPAEAKREMGLKTSKKAILSFGRIKPYKGIEHLLNAFQILIKRDASYRLIIAGEIEERNMEYLNHLKGMIPSELLKSEQILFKAEFIPDAKTELYLKAADVMVLAYNQIFQSGVLFLSYTFGLPVIATDVGSFREEVVEGRTGLMCRPADPDDLARAISDYFRSCLYRNLQNTRAEIKEHARVHHSWEAVAELTQNAYAQIQEH